MKKQQKSFYPTITTHYTNLELRLLLRLLRYDRSPVYGMYTVIVLPRFHRDHALGEIYQVWQSPRHGTEDTRYSFLSRHARIHPHLRPATS